MRNPDEREEGGSSVAVAVSPATLEERRTTAWLGKAVTIQGDVNASENLIIDGHVEGRIDLHEHHLIVGTGGAINGEVKARVVTIRGAVIGNITATAKIEILDTGSVEGDIRAPHFAIQEGGVLCGKVNADGAKALAV